MAQNRDCKIGEGQQRKDTCQGYGVALEVEEQRKAHALQRSFTESVPCEFHRVGSERRGGIQSLRRVVNLMKFPEKWNLVLGVVTDELASIAQNPV